VGSVDSNGGTLTYLWNFGDGGSSTSTAANPTHTYTFGTVRTFTATLTVRNPGNQTATASTTVTVGSLPPNPVISAPANGTGYIPGQTVTFQGAATDPEDGPIAAANLSWMVLLHHNQHIHIVNTAVGAQGSFTVANHGPIGTFFYELVLTARDSSGLEGSTSISLPVNSDSVPPSAPTGLVASAVAPGVVDLSWTAATDNGAVDSYILERLNPGGLDYVQISSLIETSYSDLGLGGQQVYSYRVRAVDASGNLGPYSNVATVTTLPTSPQLEGLVAAYGFDEGTGIAVGDASGNGNNGGIGAAAWTTSGKYGKALTFNGANALVTVGDANSLDLTTGMTLEAWVYPTGGGGWRDVIYKGPDDTYYLMGSSDNGTPAIGGSFSPTVLRGSSSLPLNAWSHLSGSYDGTTMKLYVNGVLVSNRGQTGPIQASAASLTIGGDPLYGQYFSGRIDEVRVYNRALSAAEIQADMNTAVSAGGGGASPPTISDISNQGTTVNTATAAIPFTVGDPDTAVTSLTVSGSSNNLTLVPNANIAFGGSGANRTVTVTPVVNKTGTATITVTVSDGVLTASDTFVLTVATVNTPPTITDISNQTTNEDTVSGAIGFTVGDGETAAGSLTVSGSSNNVTLVPNGNIVFGGSGANRTVTITPAANQNGSTTITVNVSDGLASASDSFLLTVNAVNDAPTISDIVDQSTLAGTVGPLNFTVGDVETAAGTLSVSGSSSNLALVPNGNIAFGGSGANRTVTVTPAAGQSGNATITVSVSDGTLTATDSFVLTVSTPPSGGLVAAYGFNESSGTTVADASGNGNRGAIGSATWTASGKYGSALSFNGASARVTVADANSLDLTTGMTLEAWVNPTAGGGWRDVIYKGPDDIYYLMGSSDNGTPSIGGTFSPNPLRGSSSLPMNTWSHLAATYDGTAMRLYVNGVLVSNVAQAGSIQVSTGALTIGGDALYGQYFSGRIDEVRVYNRALSAAEIQADMNTPVSAGGGGASPPTITDINNQSTTVNTATAAIPFTVGDPDTAVTSLTVSGSSNNVTLVPNANIAFGGSGANRTVTVTPATNQTGTATVTVTVSDGTLTASDTFVLTVATVNTPPTISDISNQTTNEDTASGAIGFTVGDGETAAGSLTVNGSSNNVTLVPNGNIVFGGSGANRTVTITPAANQNGSTTITVNVSDGLASASDSFLLTVNAVNDAPTISDVVDQSTLAGTAVGPLNFTVGDVETAVGTLTVIGISSNQTLVPNGSIAFGGSGANRTVTVTPAAGQSGNATITVSVSDGALTATDSFVLTVSTPPSGGLVAAYGFNESSGTTVGDGSGNGNNGTVNGATRVGTGKFGGALSFNGVNNMVVISDSNSLDLTSGMTLEAWIMPAVFQSGWRTIIQKEVDTYLLHASSNTALMPATGATFGGSVPTIYSPSTIAVGQWVHLAGTYDGSQIRLYINGTQVASTARTGLIAVNNLPMRIGGNSPYGEFFNGLIDEVRVYNRALSAAEIQADMNTPVPNGPLQSPIIQPIVEPPNGNDTLPQVTIQQTQRNGAIVISIEGVVGQSYRIEMSEDLVNWREFQTVADDYTGVSIIADMESPMPPNRFYRVFKSQ
jgi:hypothetical protein